MHLDLGVTKSEFWAQLKLSAEFTRIQIQQSFLVRKCGSSFRLHPCRVTRQQLSRHRAVSNMDFAFAETGCASK